MYYKKLDFPIVTGIDTSRLKGGLQNQYGVPGVSNTFISYYKIKEMDYFTSLFGELDFEIPPETFWYMEVTFVTPEMLPPHIDHGPKCCINYHIESCDAKTAFYKIINDDPYKCENNERVNTKNMYDLENLFEADSYVAKDNEAYFLNISKPHSVTSYKSGVRKAITWQWHTYSFKEIFLTL